MAPLVTLENLSAMARIYGGMPYLGSLPDSPAERAGLCWGDIVLAVNDVPTPDVEAFVAARKQREGGCLVRFVRGGEERVVELSW